MAQTIKLCVVVSVFNEEGNLKLLDQQLISNLEKLKLVFKVVYVNDGSSDSSPAILDQFAHKDSRVEVIHLTRNFGHEAAMLAGLRQVEAEAYLCMDADLQHPPALIKEFFKAFLQGSAVVLGQRLEQSATPTHRQLTSKLFYLIQHQLNPSQALDPNTTDFFLLGKKQRDFLTRDLPEVTRFTKGLLYYLGAKPHIVPFKAPARHAGESKYNLAKLLTLTTSAILPSNTWPLHLATIMALVMGGLSVGLIIFSVVMKVLGNTIPGYTTIVVFVSFVACVQFLILAIIGQYIAILVQEAKKRPPYLIDRVSDKT